MWGYSGGGGGLISGSVADYSLLPAPASAHTGELWYVQTGSGGLFSALGSYKYPKGIYSPNASNVWELTPLNVKVSEDSTTLVNITDWAEFISYAFDIMAGDTLIYNGQTFVNQTGSMISTTPNLDETNWRSYLDIAPNTDVPYKPGRIWYDAVTKAHMMDTGYTDVRVDIGREMQIEVFNNTASIINNGDPVSTDLTFTGILPNAVPTKSSEIFSILAFGGVATMDILVGESGLVTFLGLVKGVNTQSLIQGFIYADDNGFYTQIRPRHPFNRLLVGVVAKTGVTDGIIQVHHEIIARKDGSKSYGFTSQGVGAGLFYKAGFYDWATTSITLTQASLTQTHGTVGRAYAAHASIVPSGPGIVDTGQVGLRVTGIEDSETGIQIAAQTGIVTDDITTLTLDTMYETSEKFSGQVTYELYVVSGAPTSYSLAFNYGYSKYEDVNNQDLTITGLECVWQGNALDTNFDIALKHHKPDGWTYAAAGFLPGNGDIARKSVDQALAGDVVNNEDGAWKRVSLDTFIDGNGSEGILWEITTGANNTIQTMDLHISAVSEEL